ncbi:hypothetical protein NOS3756_57370 (plasmid) [Nostoc sp. NIES-3756]|uniref:hypothetical protein n=1 Tax=Nostoc sp. NIES-3756 TaxID=1751286 RepID=UPI00071FE149|nr:hypothetical protein [Nostoc sp. NIES-3756]BAT56725.1 hypothetical protein NOS3756_57370 [Nostoc sp. NIES-3756]BAY41614.1 hypothetical protein NIES2111_60100 [Nostoc sp. NIES-2111]
MTQIPIVRQILLDADTGLLSYLNKQLQTPSFSSFKAQLGFHVDEYSTLFDSSDDLVQIQTTLSLTLKLSIIIDSQLQEQEATLHALEFLELLDAKIIKWGQEHKKLLKPISFIQGTLSQLTNIPYHGGSLPGFEINAKLNLTYDVGNVSRVDDEVIGEQASAFYNPGDRTPISGQYELINPDGEATGLEVTSTAGHPFPPTKQADQSYKLVDPTKHKKPHS